MLKLTGNLEQQVMNILLENSVALKPSEVQAKLDQPFAYTTIMTILQRLYKKGVLIRERDGNAYRYAPKLSKDKYATSTLNNMYQNLLEAYGTLAISHFIESVKKDPKHHQLLKEYLAEHDE